MIDFLALDFLFDMNFLRSHKTTIVIDNIDFFIFENQRISLQFSFVKRKFFFFISSIFFKSISSSFITKLFSLNAFIMSLQLFKSLFVFFSIYHKISMRCFSAHIIFFDCEKIISVFYKVILKTTIFRNLFWVCETTIFHFIFFDSQRIFDEQRDILCFNNQFWFFFWKKSFSNRLSNIFIFFSKKTWFVFLLLTKFSSSMSNLISYFFNLISTMITRFFLKMLTFLLIENRNFERIKTILEKYTSLFKSEFDFIKHVIMFILFRDENDIASLKQSSYNLSVKDRKVMNDIFNSLIQQNRVEKIFLNKFFSTASLIFVIWRKNKLKVIVDLQRINSKLMFDAYFFFKQNIIFFLNFAFIFSTFDLIKSFFQVSMIKQNKWKTTFVTSHRNQEQMIIFQHEIDQHFRVFPHLMKNVFQKIFLKIFTDVYQSRYYFLSEYWESFSRHWNNTQWTQIIDFMLQLLKCHFEYFSLNLLKHKVDRLKLFTQKIKIVVIVIWIFEKISNL